MSLLDAVDWPLVGEHLTQALRHARLLKSALRNWPEAEGPAYAIMREIENLKERVERERPREAPR